MNSGLRLSEASPARKASRTSFPPARRLSAGRMTWPSLARTGTARPLTDSEEILSAGAEKSSASGDDASVSANRRIPSASSGAVAEAGTTKRSS